MNKTRLKEYRLILILATILAVLIGMLIILNTNIKQYDKLSCSEQTSWQLSGVEICIPDVVYVAEGINLEIYNRQISNLGEHISEYHVEWTIDNDGVTVTEDGILVAASKGMNDEFSVNVSVLDKEGRLLAKKDFSIKIAESKQWPFSILAIGDSLSANGALYTRLQELLGNQMICNGTRGYEGYLTEARLGFSAKDYLTETGYYLEEGEGVHKFWNPDTKRFDWNYYKNSTGFQPNVILLHLGTNGLLSGDENAENICKIVEFIRKDDPDLPIYVVNTIYQSDQNGIGSMEMNNGSLMFPGQYKQERDLANFKLRAYLTDHLENIDKVYLVPASICVNSENVFYTEEYPVNPYSDNMEAIATDAVHPAEEGYRQLADTIYSTMCGTMKEW